MFDSKIIRIRELSQILDVPITTIYRWQRNGSFPKSTKYGPATSGWPRKVIEKWLYEKQSSSLNNQTTEEV